MSRRRLVRVAAGAAVGMAAAAGVIWRAWRQEQLVGEALLAAVVARLDADDPGWRPDRLTFAYNMGLPTAAGNAAGVAATAYALFPRPAELPDEEAVLWPRGRPFNRRPPADKWAEFAAVHARRAAAVAAARPLRHLPRGGAPLWWADPDPHQTPVPQLEAPRRVAGLLAADAVAEVQAGRPDAAVESVRTALAAGRAIGDEPQYISQACRASAAADAAVAAERVFGLGEPAAGLAELQDAFAAEYRFPRLAVAARGERALADRQFRNLADGRLTWAAVAAHPWVKPKDVDGWRDLVTVGCYRRSLADNWARALELHSQVLAIARLSGPARRAVVAAVDTPTSAGHPHRLAHLLAPNVRWLAAVDDRARARLGTAVVALACERFRLRTGRWPAVLADLPPDLLPDPPADPYTGEPFVYRRRPDGVTVYSVGPDGTDDAGADLSYAPTPPAGTDVGFRLWDPAFRGLPPEPAAP